MTTLSRLMALAAATSVMTGCVALHRDAVVTAQPDAYLAIGTEPFWSLEITERWLTYNDVERRAVRVANPGMRKDGEQQTYATETIAVRIVPGACSDGMSDRRYADRVSVRIGNGPVHLNGCGGPALTGP